jgi:hypothetical protein
MRLHPAWGLILFFLAALVTGSLAYGGDQLGGVPKGYTQQELEGFTLYVNQQVLDHPRDRWGRPTLSVLEHELNDLRRILVPRIFKVLQDVPVWVEWDNNSNAVPGAVAVYYGGDGKQLESVGVNPQKSQCIEIVSLRILGEIRHPGTALQQIIILHEMSHAVHHRLLGYDNPELNAIFQQAVDRKLYDKVNDRFGRQTKAYARTSAAEYFAEISCAYLDSCNYFPFNYQQLQGYDPAGFAFVERVWKHPERFALIASKSGSGASQSSALAAPAKPSVYAERDAQLTLDRLRAQSKDGVSDTTRKGLEDLVRRYPSTAAADEARQMLSTSK